MYTITIEESFSAAHAIRDYKGPCSRMHGHNYKAIVSVTVEKLDELGLAMDFHELKQLVKNIINQLDHQNLNELGYFSYQNPTAENIARFIYTQIQEELPSYVHLKEVTIAESESSRITYSEKTHENQ